MQNYLDFEKPIAELETRVAELRETASSSDDIDIDPEIGRLEAKASKLLRDTYAKLSPWQKAQVARHPDRPHFKDYVAGLADDFLPLAGDRAFGDDAARRALVMAFDALGEAHELVSSYRRRMANLLH